MGVPPAKLHEKPAEANKSGTESEQKAGFFDPVTEPFGPRKLMKNPVAAVTSVKIRPVPGFGPRA
jgi:hypothetical protein